MVSEREKQLKNYNKAIFIIFILSVFFGMWAVISKRNETRKLVEKLADLQYTFEGEYLSGHAPHTVVINYDISQLIGYDTILVDFDDKYLAQKRFEVLDKTKKKITHSYLFADYYRIKLIANKKVLKTLGVHVLTKGWQTRISHKNLLTGTFEYFDLSPNLDTAQHRLYVSPQQVQELGIPKTDAFFVEHHNIRNFDADLDNLMFETRIKNAKPEGGINCYDAIIFLIGENNHVRIQFLQEGCTQWVTLQISDVQISGSYNNLSMFGKDLSDWHTVKIETDKKQLHVYFDEIPIFTQRYIELLGELKGILYVFKGCGSVDNIKVINRETQEEVYFQDFKQTSAF
ncbi:MAG: hypothetical protein NZM38_10030 [Cytophagales bacterium]|nr:hypothetical protein [Cytophagales bacterium]MDW8385093.1 hypothetical protein [Flammeovirgaceae bacterium]